MSTAIVIPARKNSSRLPNKVLLDLKGKSVIQRVYEQCLKVKNIEIVIIAVDDNEVFEHCSHFTKNVVLTSSEHESGTDRIAEVAQNLNVDFIINVQGDEPFIDPLLIEALQNSFCNDVSMVSAMSKISKVEDLINPNVVKVVVNNDNEALYFSRAPLPYDRDNFKNWKNDDHLPEHIQFYRHLGIYGYTKTSLLNFTKSPQTILEKIEKLEQLRFLENKGNIKMVETSHNSFGIDTYEDYKLALTLVK